MAASAADVVSEAYVTLVSSNSYAQGACVLGHSLRKSKTTKVLAVMVTADVGPEQKAQLNEVFDLVVKVDTMDSKDTANLALLQRPELGPTFTKIQAWTLGQFSKCVFLDADTLVVRNIDDLFERPEIAAAPDVGWPDCFNSGVFVFEPSMETYENIVACAAEQGSFDGGDQGLLNNYFKNWSTSDSSHRLPFTYNMTANASYGYVPAFERFKDEIRVLHFIGSHKPWHGMPHPGPGMAAVVALVERWWRVRDEYISYCSSSCSYKMSFGARPTRSPGPEAETLPPPPPSLSGSAAHTHHDIHRPLASSTPDYNTPAGFGEIQYMIDQRIHGEPAASPHDSPSEDNGMPEESLVDEKPTVKKSMV